MPEYRVVVTFNVQAQSPEHAVQLWNEDWRQADAWLTRVHAVDVEPAAPEPETAA